MECSWRDAPIGRNPIYRFVALLMGNFVACVRLAIGNKNSSENRFEFLVKLCHFLAFLGIK
jgi:hypothetical protein